MTPKMNRYPTHRNKQKSLKLNNEENDWEPVDAVSIWNDTGHHKTETAQMKKDDGDVKVKIHSDEFIGSEIPPDMTGCECLVSVDSSLVRAPATDAEPDKYYQETISEQKTVGNHTVITCPMFGAIFNP